MYVGLCDLLLEVQFQFYIYLPLCGAYVCVSFVTMARKVTVTVNSFCGMYLLTNCLPSSSPSCVPSILSMLIFLGAVDRCFQWLI